MNFLSDAWKRYLVFGSLSTFMFYFSFSHLLKYFKLKYRLRTEGVRPVSYLHSKVDGLMETYGSRQYKGVKPKVQKLKLFVSGTLVPESNDITSMTGRPTLMRVYNKRGLHYTGSPMYFSEESSMTSAPTLYLQDIETNQKVKLRSDVVNHLGQFTHLGYENTVTHQLPFLKSLGYGVLSFVGSLFFLNDFGYTFGYKEQEFVLSVNTPLFMYATAYVNNETGAIVLKSSDYLAGSLKELKKLVDDVSLGALWISAISGALALYFLHKLYQPVKLSVLTRMQEKALERIKRKLVMTSKVDEDDIKCIICYNAVRDVILMPCRHVCLCYGCYYQCQDVRNMAEKCPMCKTSVVSVIRLKYALSE